MKHETALFTPRRILALLLANAAVAAAILAMWMVGRAVLIRELRAKAIQLATLVSMQTDPELLAQIDGPEDMESDAFKKVVSRFQETRDSLSDIRYVYTMRHRPDLGPHQWTFIVDADPFDDDSNEDGRITDDEKGAPPGLQYDSEDLPAMERALEEPDADYEFTTDDWGTWMSGYAPIRGPDGKAFAIQGVDIPVTEFHDKMRLANIATSIVLGLLLGLTNLALYLVFAKSRAIAEIERLDSELQVRNVELRHRNEVLDTTVKELAERARVMAEELELAQEVQQRFLPREFPCHGRVQCAALYRACSTIGGDLYDAFAVGENAAAFFIADVSGHGVSAALVTAIVKVTIERHAALLDDSFSGTPGCETQSLAKFLGAMNRSVSGALRTGSFVTFCLVVLRLDTGAVYFANAGHNAPAFWRRGNSTATCADLPSNLPLGILRDWEFQICADHMTLGDKLILYTDGIVELNDEAGEEFGTERLLDVLSNSGTHPPARLLDDVTHAMTKFAANHPPGDDVAVLVVEYMGSAQCQVPSAEC